MGTILPPAEGSDNRPRRSASTIRERWRREVYRTRLVPAGTKLVLLAMSEHMTTAGRFSQPRQVLVTMLGLPEQRIAEALQRAVAVRLLDRVVKGRVGMTAVYAALIPAIGSNTESVVLDAEASNTETRMLPGHGNPDAPHAHEQHGIRAASSKRNRTSGAERSDAAPASTSELPSDEVHEVDVIDGIRIVRGLDLATVTTITKRLAS